MGYLFQLTPHSNMQTKEKNFPNPSKLAIQMVCNFLPVSNLDLARSVPLANTE
jgi:hypothetical protein